MSCRSCSRYCAPTSRSPFRFTRTKKPLKLGFAKENAAGIPLDAAERNYKDPNHKPELVFALTPFLAMNAFREFSEIVSLLQPVAGAHNAIAHFLENPNAEALSELFASLLNMQGEEKSHALAVLKAALNSQQGRAMGHHSRNFHVLSGRQRSLLSAAAERR